MYKYTHVQISGLDMENTLRIICKKALLELHGRVWERAKRGSCMGGIWDGAAWLGMLSLEVRGEHCGLENYDQQSH